MALHIDLSGVEDITQKTSQRLWCECPIPSLLPLVAINLADAGHGEEQHTAWAQGRVELCDRRAHVVNQVERLRKHDAIEGVAWQHVWHGEITNDRSALMV